MIHVYVLQRKSVPLLYMDPNEQDDLLDTWVCIQETLLADKHIYSRLRKCQICIPCTPRGSCVYIIKYMNVSWIPTDWYIEGLRNVTRPLYIQDRSGINARYKVQQPYNKSSGLHEEGAAYYYSISYVAGVIGRKEWIESPSAFQSGFWLVFD